MTKERVYLVDLQVRYPSCPDDKIRTLLERNGFEVYGCNSNIDHEFQYEEAEQQQSVYSLDLQSLLD